MGAEAIFAKVLPKLLPFLKDFFKLALPTIIEIISKIVGEKINSKKNNGLSLLISLSQDNYNKCLALASENRREEKGIDIKSSLIMTKKKQQKLAEKYKYQIEYEKNSAMAGVWKQVLEELSKQKALFDKETASMLDELQKSLTQNIEKLSEKDVKELVEKDEKLGSELAQTLQETGT